MVQWIPRLSGSGTHDVIYHTHW